MQKRKGDDWFPFWIDKWLLGSTRDELTIEQCAIWVDFLALSYKDEGYIRANKGIPYPIKRLAGLLNRPAKLIQATIDRCLEPKINKLRLESDGTLYVVSHPEYELSKRHKRRLRAQEDVRQNGHDGQKKDTTRTKADEKRRGEKRREDKKRYNVQLQKKIIDYFNETTKQKRSYKSAGTNKLINARIEEGRTFKDFVHVIDTKTAAWQYDEKMRVFIRPSTLFRVGNFENYLNEPYQDPKKGPEDPKKKELEEFEESQRKALKNK